jgi:preprotein translocase subunit SecF
MELFKNTNYDFLGKKWPFIIASLVLTVAGFTSILMQGGLKFGIDFKGGTLMTVKFSQKPPIEKIRGAFARSGKINGEVTVQNFTDPQTQNEIEIGTELVNEKQLAANRQAMEDVLAATFAQPGSGKLDLNGASKETLAARLRDPLAAAGVPMAEPQLQKVVEDILNYRDTPPRSGLIADFGQLSSLPGVNAGEHSNTGVLSGAIYREEDGNGRPQGRGRIAKQSRAGDALRAGGHVGLYCIPV